MYHDAIYVQGFMTRLSQAGLVPSGAETAGFAHGFAEKCAEMGVRAEDMCVKLAQSRAGTQPARVVDVVQPARRYFFSENLNPPPTYVADPPRRSAPAPDPAHREPGLFPQFPPEDPVATSGNPRAMFTDDASLFRQPAVDGILDENNRVIEHVEGGEPGRRIRYGNRRPQARLIGKANGSASQNAVHNAANAQPSNFDRLHGRRFREMFQNPDGTMDKDLIARFNKEHPGFKLMTDEQKRQATSAFYKTLDSGRRAAVRRAPASSYTQNAIELQRHQHKKNTARLNEAYNIGVDSPKAVFDKIKDEDPQAAYQWLQAMRANGGAVVASPRDGITTPAELQRNRDMAEAARQRIYALNRQDMRGVFQASADRLNRRFPAFRNQVGFTRGKRNVLGESTRWS